ncbi:MAG: hypothetical protein IKD96_05680 [Oscillospiraceae bacterium]|nr:hypothetical protein [Oscillospiraceae bacterium]
MGKLSYLSRRVRNMSFGRMWETAGKIHEKYGKNRLVTFLDMGVCGLKYSAGYMDYYVCEFCKLSGAQRATYITRGVNNAYVQRLNSQECWDTFNNKVEFARTFGPYMGRGLLYLPDTDKTGFAEFLRGKDKLVVKPIDATCGVGFALLTGEDLKDPDALYDRLMASGQTLAEEFIVQHPEMSRLYPDSVNTLRIVTITVNNHPRIVFSSLRVGNGKQVDNLNAGGLALVLDRETGLITKPAVDKENRVFTAHPITGTNFIGFTPPFYQEAVALVKRAALVEPRMGYVGWDVAITERGPILIEANQFPGHDIYQFQPHLEADRCGLRPVFDKALRDED